MFDFPIANRPREKTRVIVDELLTIPTELPVVLDLCNVVPVPRETDRSQLSLRFGHLWCVYFCLEWIEQVKRRTMRSSSNWRFRASSICSWAFFSAASKSEIPRDWSMLVENQTNLEIPKASRGLLAAIDVFIETSTTRRPTIIQSEWLLRRTSDGTRGSGPQPWRWYQMVNTYRCWKIITSIDVIMRRHFPIFSLVVLFTSALPIVAPLTSEINALFSLLSSRGK